MYYKVTVKSEKCYEEDWVFDSNIAEEVKYFWDRKRHLLKDKSLGKLEIRTREIIEEVFKEFLRQNKSSIRIREHDVMPI